MSMHVRSLALHLPQIPVAVSALIAAVLIAAAALASWMTPTLVEVSDAPDLDRTVPRAFGDWKELPSPYAHVALSTGTEPDMDQPYDQTVMRTYVNSKGQQVMLALAWGKRQRQEVKIHRPDLCYVAQGFKVKSLVPVRFDAIHAPDGQAVVGKHMLAARPTYSEVVSYWIRIGDLFSENAFETRMRIFRAGLSGYIPDGILVRASMRVSSTTNQLDATYAVLDSFLVDLVKAVPRSTRFLLLGRDDSADMAKRAL